MHYDSYKQNKFNLLREQTEGYSKLTVELTSSLGPPHSSVDARPAESFASIHERARAVWAKVMSLIGYFDLDPNRALDIILDVLTVNLATHYHFLLRLLSFSPWAGAHKRRVDVVDTSMTLDPASNPYRGKSFDEVLQIAESAAVSTPITTETGSQVLAQVLGFKFAHYQVCRFVVLLEGFLTLHSLPMPMSSRNGIYTSWLPSLFARALSLLTTSILMCVASICNVTNVSFRVVVISVR